MPGTNIEHISAQGLIDLITAATEEREGLANGNQEQKRLERFNSAEIEYYELILKAKQVELAQAAAGATPGAGTSPVVAFGPFTHLPTGNIVTGYVHQDGTVTAVDAATGTVDDAVLLIDLEACKPTGGSAPLTVPVATGPVVPADGSLGFTDPADIPAFPDAPVHTILMDATGGDIDLTGWTPNITLTAERDHAHFIFRKEDTTANALAFDYAGHTYSFAETKGETVHLIWDGAQLHLG